MKRMSAFIAAALVSAMVMSLFATPSAQAHAAIVAVAWDNPSAPTRVIGRTGGDLISSAPGDFSFKLINASGIQVDNGDARVAPSFQEISVGVPASLPSGTYSVEWTVTSADGHRESGKLSITLTRGSTTAQPTPAAATMPVPSDSHADHSHDEPTMTGPDHRVGEKVTLELRMTGAQEVPPVSSPASAFARLTFDPATNELAYAITVSGVAPGAVTGLHIHRGGPGQNGPHVFDIINEPFTTVAGKTVLSSSAVNDLYAGNLYLRLHTVSFPQGAARAQIIMPAAGSHIAPVAPAVSVRPPSTGDAGLAATGRTAARTWLTPVVVAALIAAGGAGSLATARIR